MMNILSQKIVDNISGLPPCQRKLIIVDVDVDHNFTENIGVAKNLELLGFFSLILSVTTL